MRVAQVGAELRGAAVGQGEVQVALQPGWWQWLVGMVGYVGLMELYRDIFSCSQYGLIHA